jgi:hypothetical protein
VRFDNGQFGTTSRRQPSALIITTGCVAKPPQKSQLLPARYELGLRLPPGELPVLHGAGAVANIPPPARQSEHRQPDDAQATLVQLGKIQIEDLFAHHSRNPLDDSEYLPLLDTLIESFARAGLNALRVQELRRHACELYHRYCQEAEPASTFEANMKLMFSYLPASSQTQWSRWI